MFERYTERARRVLFFARYEASEFGSRSIEPEHLLLGLIREGKGLHNRVFARSNVAPVSIRQELECRMVFSEKFSTSVEIPFSEGSKHILQYAVEEADRLRHREIEPEHLLLGILRDERSVAATILKEVGMHAAAVRQDIVTLLNESPPTETSRDPVRHLVEENAQLRAVIRELENERFLLLQFRDNAFWLHPRGQPPEGPYCWTCWDLERHLVRKVRDAGGNLYCEYCTHHRPAS